MKVGLYMADAGSTLQSKKQRRFADVFIQGAHGEKVTVFDSRQPLDDDLDCIVVFGMIYMSYWDQLKKITKPVVFIDRGYSRDNSGYFHFSVGKLRPIHYLMDWAQGEARRKKLGWEPRAWGKHTTRHNNAKADQHILICPSGPTYHPFFTGLTDVDWVRATALALRSFTAKPIMARMKTVNDKPFLDMIDGVEQITVKGGSTTIEDDLLSCHCVVTYGSSASFEGILNGVPSIVLGHGIGAPISSRILDVIDDPMLATWGMRHNWLNNLAYCQWLLGEWAEGHAWELIRETIEDETKWKVTERV